MKEDVSSPFQKTRDVGTTEACRYVNVNKRYENINRKSGHVRCPKVLIHWMLSDTSGEPVSIGDIERGWKVFQIQDPYLLQPRYLCFQT